MKRPNLLKLALKALEDPDAIPVFGDAVLESQWYDRRVMHLVIRGVLKRRHARSEFRRLAAGGESQYVIVQWARACAAVLLFRHWTRDWYPWATCRLNWTRIIGIRGGGGTATLQRSSDILKRLYPQRGVSPADYEHIRRELGPRHTGYATITSIDRAAGTITFGHEFRPHEERYRRTIDADFIVRDGDYGPRIPGAKKSRY